MQTGWKEILQKVRKMEVGRDRGGENIGCIWRRNGALFFFSFFLFLYGRRPAIGEGRRGCRGLRLWPAVGFGEGSILAARARVALAGSGEVPGAAARVAYDL